MTEDDIARWLYLLQTDDPNAVPHWDFGGEQHVNKALWRIRAREVIRMVRALDRQS